MIPFEYRLREPVRVEARPGGVWRVICEAPLVVLDVNATAARLLEHLREGAPVGAVAAALSVSEERVLLLCERLRTHGVLEMTGVAMDPDFLPSVTVVVPTRDRAAELEECLASLAGLRYPRDRLELIVVDDGSRQPDSVAAVAGRYGARLLCNPRNRGPSDSRNRAAAEAVGDLLAFIDSDCVADPEWLRALVCCFQWDRVGAVGGRTVGHHGRSLLDRYEEVASPLDMGRHPVLEAGGASTFYVPTCNLLVRRAVYAELGGLREDLRVGEDVDLCWRLRAHGQYLVYLPSGRVRHKHRTSLPSLLRRRAEYGTSEAALYSLHPDKRKGFPNAPAPWATVALVSAAAVCGRARLAPACLAPMLWDGGERMLRLRRRGVTVRYRSIWSSVLRGHLSMTHSVCFHLVRYYLAPLAATGVFVPAAKRLAFFAFLYAAAADHLTRRPRLSYPAYLGCYAAEHLAYQLGVQRGCVRSRTLRPYASASLHKKSHLATNTLKPMTLDAD